MSIALEVPKTELPQQIEKHIDLDPRNRRMKVYRLPKEESCFSRIKEILEEKAEANNCDKVIYYARKNEKRKLEKEGCHLEGLLKGFFEGEDAYIYASYLDPVRNKPVNPKEEKQVLEIVLKDNKDITKQQLPEKYTMRMAKKENAKEMAKLYDTVFATYPTPMNEAEFIIEMMENDVYFTVIEHQGCLVSACSADFFPQFNVAEMTDCATLPKYRGQGLLSYQFSFLEDKMIKKGVGTLFSYTRAVSVGMNMINSRHGYSFGGRMLQNSNISGRLEDMNIWYKII
jgi:putative beta-lysine N-acetyltransferase